VRQRVGAVYSGTPDHVAVSPEALTEHLSERGYTAIAVQSRPECCGRGKLQYAFSAIRKDGRRVAGDMCMGDFVRSYALTERVR
jgi:hypothetical protein